MPPHELVAEQSSLNEMTNKLAGSHKATPFVVPNQTQALIRRKVFHRNDCEPPKDTFTQLVHEGSRLLGPVGRIAEVLEEPWNACVCAVTIPYHRRNALNKLVNCREPLAEDIFDPELNLWCDLVVLQRIFGEVGEQGADLQGDMVHPVVKTTLVSHGCGMMKVWLGTTHGVMGLRVGAGACQARNNRSETP